MDMMDCRRTQLQAALDGYQASDTPLVALFEGTYLPAGFADDQGMYYFIPWITKTFGIPLHSATEFFFSSLMLMGVLISLGCLFNLSRHWISWLFSLVAVLLLVRYCYFDVYTFSFVAAASTIPLFLSPHRKFNWLLIGSLAFSGWVIGYCNILRSHAGTGSLLFILSWILLNTELTKQDKNKSILILILFAVMPYLHFGILEKQRDQFLVNHVPNYVSEPIVHPKWHNIYIGLSYLKNNYGIEWADMCSARKVDSIKPQVKYCSIEYEKILRNECFSIFKNDPLFIIKNILTKLFVIVFKIIKFANFGLLLLLYVRPPFRTLIPFCVAMSFYSLPGILTLPINAYLTGLHTVSTLFGVYMIGLAIKKYQTSSIKQPSPT